MISSSPSSAPAELERRRVATDDERHADRLAGRPRVVAREPGRVGRATDVRRDGRIDPALEIGDVLGIERQPRRELEPARARRLGEPLELGPGRLRVHVVDRHGRDAAPVVDAGVEQARKVVEGEVRRRLHVPAGAEQDARDGDRPEVVVEGRLLVCSHPRAGLRAEVLDDDLLDVPVLVAERLQGEERVDPLLARLADPDEDPARERDRELAGEADRLEAPRGDLVGRGPVRPALLSEPLRGRLEHDPHRGGDGPQRFQLRARHDPGIEVRQQPRLLEHEPRAALEVLERRLAAERPELLARDLVAQLRLVAEREERFVAAGRRSGARDREHLLLGHERALAAPRRPRERAVAAHVTTERRERDEDLRRVRDERPRPQTTRLREQLLERCGEKVGGAHHPVASIRRDRAVAFVYEATDEGER